MKMRKKIQLKRRSLVKDKDLRMPLVRFRSGKKSTSIQMIYPMRKFPNNMTSVILMVMTLLVGLEINKHVALVILSDLSKLFNLVSRLNTVKILRNFLLNKFSTAIISLRDVLEDGLIWMPISWSMLTWFLRNALLTLLPPKVIPVEPMRIVSQRLKFKAHTLLEEASLKFQRIRWWKTSSEMDQSQLNFKPISSLRGIDQE